MSAIASSVSDRGLAEIVRESSVSLRKAATDSVAGIRAITGRMRLLAMNALIEAAHAGEKGAGFSVVAQEVRAVADEIERLATALGTDLGTDVDALTASVARLAEEALAARNIDLALNAIEIIDRNLYERTCDVRWWATDAAVVACAAEPTQPACAHAARRLGVILSSYSVYLDLWLCSLDGTVLANGRPDRYLVAGRDVRSEAWFQLTEKLRSGADFGAADVMDSPGLDGAQVATYVASVREGGEVRGRPLGYLAIHFDWEPQARAVMEGVRLAPNERGRTCVMLLDADDRIIASSNGRPSLRERHALPRDRGSHGHYRDENQRLVAFHRTPGYETYRGLGWCGVIVQEAD